MLRHPRFIFTGMREHGQAPQQLPLKNPVGFPLLVPQAQAQAQRRLLLFSLRPLLSCHAQNLTVASLLIRGVADGAEEWSPAGMQATLGRGNGLVGWPALGRALGPGIGLERSRQCQELLTLALKGARDSVPPLTR